MSSRKRMILAVVLLVTMLMVGTLGMATATTFRHGNIRVQVTSHHPGGDNINLVVPAGLAEAVVALAPLGMIRDELPLDELEPYLPAIRQLSRQVRDLPDAVYVEVHSRHETVKIEKRDGRFIIDVQDRNEQVHISVPVTTVNRVVSKIQDLV
ncbi:MAG: hypothetical protein IFK94_11680 [Acidobacteria bacterium]|uniref:Uncharacterized protein n=1 Tax=Candidatus Polarisedimenticola svalbardensis TaxID=2886004 RepID=A0A8J7C318_9BACT|nr:hypothetical protein [Candidatus Polarisedimenticola svalbardensis]